MMAILVLLIGLLPSLNAFANISPDVFIKIPAGTFLMGSPESDPNHEYDEFQHTVRLSHDFEMQATAVTQLQWFKVTGFNPSAFQYRTFCEDEYIEIGATRLCPNHPVEQVSWDDAQSYLALLNQQNDSYLYRLPTEAEWEYAARAGAQTPYAFGEDARELGSYAWFYYNSSHHSHSVGSKKPNAWGLYDMQGNVSQWVQDFYYSYRVHAPVDPIGPSTGVLRIGRGGNWTTPDEKMMRSAYRLTYGLTERSPLVGFRVVRVPLGAH